VLLCLGGRSDYISTWIRSHEAAYRAGAARARGHPYRRHGHSMLVAPMAMKTLEYLPGISQEDCRRLRARGIRHSNQLLHAVTLEIDRQRLSAKTGISEPRLLEFGRQCSMLEISGMEPFLPVVRRLGVTGLKVL
jgi:hypothetical protein